ncbi:hypothetical protein [Mesoflavibacter sp. CH_XMU1404-2]|uniref:hypothetical protein n=1 Tax=Mesoflavibacter sp. CH_XMU1404-2 TaxID=3107766 RepID=UPI0030081C28
MRKYYLTSLMLLSIKIAMSQVGIGTTNPTSSSILDIVSTNKGVLLPRIFLNSTTDVSTISTPATGLLIYNTATISDVVPAFYYWNGMQWVKISNDEIKDDWSLSGNDLNSGTGTEFIGTTSNHSFLQKVNNQQIGILDTNGSTVFGFGASSTVNDAVVMGRNATASAPNSVTLGYDAETNSNDAVSVGYQSDASGYQSLSLGYQSRTTQNYNNAIGYKATSTGYNATSIGISTEATGQESLAIGFSSNPTGGNKTIASGYQSLAIGRDAKSTGATAVAIGNTAFANNTNSLAIGNNARSKDYANTIAIGADAIAAGGQGSIAIGNTAKGSNAYGISIGFDAETKNAQRNLAIGYNSTSSATDNIVIGTDANSNSNYGIAIGYSTYAKDYDNTIAIGYDALSDKLNAIAIGNLAQAKGNNSISVGNNARANGSNSVAIGQNTNVTNANTIALGDETGAVRVGVGTNSPTANFHLNGSLRIVDGNQGVDKVLKSDANGNANWVFPDYVKYFSDTTISGTIVNASGTTVTGNGIIRLNTTTYVGYGTAIATNGMYVTISKSGYYRLSYNVNLRMDDTDADRDTVQIFFATSATGAEITRTKSYFTFVDDYGSNRINTVTLSRIVHLNAGDNVYLRILNPSGPDVSLVTDGSGATIESIKYD